MAQSAECTGQIIGTLAGEAAEEDTLGTLSSGDITEEPGALAPAGAPAELTPEQRFDRVADAVLKQPMHREILYRTLVFCKQQRDLPDVEAEIATYPEFKHAAQNQYRLITALVDSGGLDRLELDEDGEIVTSERTEGLSEDEIDDLVASYALLTTEAGAAVAGALDPRQRIFEIFSLDPAYEDTYVEVLEYCRTPRTVADIDALLKDRSVLAFGRSASEQAIKPSFFVDQLERGGGIIWKDGWVLTADGEEILETLKTGR